MLASREAAVLVNLGARQIYQLNETAPAVRIEFDRNTAIVTLAIKR